jgi:hypothetical protein
MLRAAAVTAALLFLAPYPQSGDETPKPPQGWKEFSPKDKAFTVWIPENPRRQAERERTTSVRGTLLKITVLQVEMPSGVIYHVEKLTLTGAILTKLKRKELEDTLKDVLLAQFRGKLAEESEAKLGALTGKEYLIETGKGLAKARVFVGGAGRVVIVLAEGTKEQVEDKGTQIFLDSVRLGEGTAVARDGDSGKKESRADAAGKGRTKIQGGAFDPEFTDTAPAGGLLVGFEFGLGRFVNNEVIKAGRPIYRVGDMDVPGKQYGNDMNRAVKVVAKQGYAVGAISVKAGLVADGLSVTFMKVDNGRLDPKDSYDSEWIGGKGGGNAERLGGDGTAVIGMIGKSNKTELTGVGLLLQTSDEGKQIQKQKL